jgi:hypothetical protein
MALWRSEFVSMPYAMSTQFNPLDRGDFGVCVEQDANRLDMSAQDGGEQRCKSRFHPVVDIGELRLTAAFAFP